MCRKEEQRREVSWVHTHWYPAGHGNCNTARSRRSPLLQHHQDSLPPLPWPLRLLYPSGQCRPGPTTPSTSPCLPPTTSIPSLKETVDHLWQHSCVCCHVMMGNAYCMPCAKTSQTCLLFHLLAVIKVTFYRSRQCRGRISSPCIFGQLVKTRTYLTDWMSGVYDWFASEKVES